MEKITGKNNEQIKSVKKLILSSGKRRAENRFVLEGARLAFDALNSFYKIKLFLVTQDALCKYGERCEKIIAAAEKSFIISQDVAQKLGETKNLQGVFAVCEDIGREFELKLGGKYIALDNIQDPGNLGTIVRTAEALGIDGIIAGGGCDIYNPKALRASMGSALRINLLRCADLAAELSELKGKGFAVYASSPDSKAASVRDIDFSGAAVCVIGNEANGISPECIEQADSLVTIKMLGRAESLNASAAASIIMWEMLR